MIQFHRHVTRGLVLIFAAVAVPAANAQKSAGVTKHYICWAANLDAGLHSLDAQKVPDKRFYSNVFTAQSSEQTVIQKAFTRYLQSTFPNDKLGPGRCRLYDSDDAAQGWLNTTRTEDNSNNRKVFDTGWAHGATVNGNYAYCMLLAGDCSQMTTKVFRTMMGQDSLQNEWIQWVQANTQCGSAPNKGCVSFSTKAEADENFNSDEKVNLKVIDWLPSR